MVQFPENLFHSSPYGYSWIWSEGQFWGPLETEVAGDGGLQPGPVATQGGLHFLAISQRVEPHMGVTEIGVGPHTGHGDQLEPVVVQPLELVADDLA